MAQNRLVTLCGTGGVGKTRLAIQIASASELRDGLCFVDLAPITESGIVAATAARAVGLPDQPGRSTMDSLRRFIGNRRMLMVLDNCEHLLDACAALVVELLGACPELTILATSREPIGMAGEITWRVPSMSITDEAVELFADRASRVQPGFTIANHNAAAVGEICRRLDGIPLAIEFAAARVRSMSPLEIADGLDDCFRLLAGGVRGAVQRQQTLRASIDWSHALLTETEQILFRRLAPFVGGFDLAAVRAVAAGSDLDPFSVLDQLTLLVDKSLVVADDCQGRTRYRLLETVRRYALEKLGDSGEADVHARHRDYYRRWPPHSTLLRTTITNGLSPGLRPRSTTCAPRSPGAGKMAISPKRYSSHLRCNQSGSGGRTCARGCPGSTRSWKTKGSTGSLCQQQYGRERSLTRQCSVPGWPPVR